MQMASGEGVCSIPLSQATFREIQLCEDSVIPFWQVSLLVSLQVFLVLSKVLFLSFKIQAHIPNQ